MKRPEAYLARGGVLIKKCAEKKIHSSMSGWTSAEVKQELKDWEATRRYLEDLLRETEQREQEEEAAEVMASMEAWRKQEEQELLEAAIALGVLRSTPPSTAPTSASSASETTTPASTSAWGGRLRPRQAQNTSKGTSTTKTP